ncbi:YlzJ-like family protein [Paenibacillus sp.]|uniref:YlzJ-like family protein n=1 Tax=Paenibacillus sp. TaxID=58172 RepID=UPI002810E5FC|nr:YlzJ-like family protein [Paenibacillus sp.]
MILYTPVPLEQVFQGIEDVKCPEEVVVGDMTLQVEMLAQGEARVVRLISPRAEDYMNPAYMPGTVFRLTR